MADQLGVHHLALWFDDLRPLLGRLDDEGVEPFWGPWFIQSPAADTPDPDRPPTGYVTMYFRDPDGICIQAEQRLSGNQGYPVLYPDGPPRPTQA
jgi:catechol 2,3-dioxygenase-like lactoylglutathione lyase family enzyme